MGATTVRRSTAQMRQTGEVRPASQRPQHLRLVPSSASPGAGAARGTRGERTRPRRTAHVDPIYRRAALAPTHSAQRPVSDGVSWRQMLTAVLFTALATAALLTIAHVRTTQVAAGAGAAVVTVVREGETPAALALRVDPDAPLDVTLAKIAEMNTGQIAETDTAGVGGLTAGHRLLVPAPDQE